MFIYAFMYVYTGMTVSKCLLYGHMYMYHISMVKFPLVENSFCCFFGLLFLLAFLE